MSTTEQREFLFRIHIRPTGGSADVHTTFAHCLAHSVLGVGWRVPELAPTSVWSAYQKAAEPVHGRVQACAYMERWVKAGSLVWTRDGRGQYYLCRVTSGWEYWVTAASEAADIDIGNVFRCQFMPVPIDSVPGKVVASFRASRTLQEVADERAFAYSKMLWNTLSGTDTYVVNKAQFNDIFMLLDDEETEDLVFMYLQTQGWMVVPNSRKGDTMKFEFLTIRPDTGERGLTQVKTGNTPLVVDDFETRSEHIFLFQANSVYVGDPRPGMTFIPRADLDTFLRSNVAWLPAVFGKKLSMIEP